MNRRSGPRREQRGAQNCDDHAQKTRDSKAPTPRETSRLRSIQSGRSPAHRERRRLSVARQPAARVYYMIRGGDLPSVRIHGMLRLPAGRSAGSHAPARPPPAETRASRGHGSSSHDRACTHLLSLTRIMRTPPKLKGWALFASAHPLPDSPHPPAHRKKDMRPGALPASISFSGFHSLP